MATATAALYTSLVVFAGTWATSAADMAASARWKPRWSLLITLLVAATLAFTPTFLAVFYGGKEVFAAREVPLAPGVSGPSEESAALAAMLAMGLAIIAATIMSTTATSGLTARAIISFWVAVLAASVYFILYWQVEGLSTP